MRPGKPPPPARRETQRQIDPLRIVLARPLVLTALLLLVVAFFWLRMGAMGAMPEEPQAPLEAEIALVSASVTRYAVTDSHIGSILGLEYKGGSRYPWWLPDQTRGHHDSQKR